MDEASVEQIRRFRLHAHHLDAVYPPTDAVHAAGACGLQNSPPGAWATALRNRVPSCDAAELDRLLLRDKELVQAWSLRGAPIVFPVQNAASFLTALIPEEDEPWIYTRGIALALDHLQMGFDELLGLLLQVMPNLDECTIASKTALDQTLASWVAPFLPADARKRWRDPSMYGSPDTQTVGGAVVSFLLRPCSFRGLVVFGQREGASPSFTSYKHWIGSELCGGGDAAKQLVRDFLRCYGPTTPDALASWLGCSGKQARRMWAMVADETEPVRVLGKQAFILTSDREALFASAPLERELLLLGPHDPYLDQRDRAIIQPDASLRTRIWKTVANPGAIVHRGEVVGVWKSKAKAKGIEVTVSAWDERFDERGLSRLVEEYAAFRGRELLGIETENL